MSDILLLLDEISSFDVAIAATAQAGTASATMEQTSDVAVAAASGSGSAAMTAEQTADVSIAGTAQPGVAMATLEELADLAVAAMAQAGVAAMSGESVADVAVAAIAQAGEAALGAEQVAEVDVAGVAQSGIAEAAFEYEAASEEGVAFTIVAVAAPGTASLVGQVDPPVASVSGGGRGRGDMNSGAMFARTFLEDRIEQQPQPVIAAPADLAINAIAQPGTARMDCETIRAAEVEVRAMATAGRASMEGISWPSHDEEFAGLTEVALDMLEAA